jgi:hypothetical protein
LIEPTTGRHDPDRRDEDHDTDDPRRDALVPTLAVTAADQPLERSILLDEASALAL